MKIPRFYSWGGGGVPTTWSSGWWAGKDNDLLCVKPKTSTDTEAEIALSPICSNRPLAPPVFVLKDILIRIDGNITDRIDVTGRLGDGNPSSR